MLGRGLKRKLEQEEENDLNKMSPSQDVSSTCYWLQRQTVLNLSLLKLHSHPAHSDPGLARRVLITNTLRHIQEELRVEGVLLPHSFPSAGSPLSSVDGCLDRPAGCGVESSSHPRESSLTPVSLLEEDRHLFLSLQSSIAVHTAPAMSRNCPSLSNARQDSFSIALDEIEDLCPTVGITTSLMTSSLSASSPESDTSGSTVPSRDVSDITSKVHSTADNSMDSTLSQFTPSLLDSAQSFFNQSTSLLTDFSLDDFVFTELDHFLLDNTPCSSSLSTSSGTSKVVSMVRDDFVKTLTGGMSQAALPSNQTFKLDLNELDHIMEVLVGS